VVLSRLEQIGGASLAGVSNLQGLASGCVMVKRTMRGSQQDKHFSTTHSRPRPHACYRQLLLHTAFHLNLLVALSTTPPSFTALLYYPAITRADTSPTFLHDHRSLL
jgi:hypothetical protein